MSIGGKSYRECLEALQSMRPAKKPKGSTGYWYYPIEEFTAAMDKVFGNEHYNIAYADPIYRKVASEQETVTVRCTLTLVDDEGMCIKSVDGFGDREILYAKSGGRADLGNLTSSAAANAFKDACKYLGIFGYRTEASDVKGDRPDNSQDKGASKSSDKKASDVSVNFIVTDMFYDQGPDSKGSPVWKLPVKNKADMVKGEVVFYHNMVSPKAERFNELYAFVEKSLADKERVKPISCKLKVKPSGERDGLLQYVFKDFAA